MKRISTGKLAYLGLGTLLALSGCSTTPADDDDGMQGGGGLPPQGGGASAPLGGTGAGPASGGSAVTGNAGAASGTSGAGGAGGAAAVPVGGAGGDVGGAGGAGGAAGAAGAAGGSGAGGIDTSSFFKDCKSGGSNWGTPQQAGPCSSGVTIYGVNIPFGPYGASSEYNVGAGFETTVNLLDSAATCSLFIDSFGADPIGSADLKDIHDLDLALHTVFYPGVMPEGETFPLITWGNGTCAMPEGYGTLLRYVASHGYIIVAANSRYVGDGAAQKKALDFMFAENEKMGSKFYHKMDLTKVGAMGHSQGGSGTAAASSDARINTVILWNGGSQASKPYLAVSGERDIGDTGSPTTLSNPVNAAPRPAAFVYFHHVPMTIAMQPTGGSAGHLTLMMEPERVNEFTVAWFDMMLKQKPEAKAMFIGDTCTLCDGSAYPSSWDPGTPSLTYGHNTMLQ